MAATTTASVPLTTTFVPAADCFTNIYLVGNTISPNTSYYYQIGASTPAHCFPSQWASTAATVFSPGICPSGYTQACSVLNSIGTVTETQATCCPTGYSCWNNDIATNFPGQDCVSSVADLLTTVVTYTTNTTAFAPETTTLTPSTDAVNGYGVRIRYQSTDFASSTAQAASTSDTSSLSSTTSASTSSTAAASPSSLSHGAAAGIGVGIGLAALAAILGFFLLCWRKQRHNQHRTLAPSRNRNRPSSLGEGAQMSHSPTDVLSPHLDGDAALPSPYSPRSPGTYHDVKEPQSSGLGIGGRQELDGGGVHEMATRKVYYEVDGMSSPVSMSRKPAEMQPAMDPVELPTPPEPPAARNLKGWLDGRPFSSHSAKRGNPFRR